MREALKRCAARNFRSENAMIESILRDYLSRNGYLKDDEAPPGASGDS